MSMMKRLFNEAHGLPQLEDIEAALDRGELPDVAFDMCGMDDLTPEPAQMCAVEGCWEECDNAYGNYCAGCGPHEEIRLLTERSES